MILGILGDPVIGSYPKNYWEKSYCLYLSSTTSPAGGFVLQANHYIVLKPREEGIMWKYSKMICK